MLDRPNEYFVIGINVKLCENVPLHVGKDLYMICVFPLYALSELPHSQSVHHDTRSPEQHGGRLLADGGAAQHPSHCHADPACGEGTSESHSLPPPK